MATTLGVSAARTMIAPACAAGPGRASVPGAAPPPSFPRMPSRAAAARRLPRLRAGPPTPPDISDKVKESIKSAEEACSGDPASGECVAAWDEVEELSAAASHARDKLKGSDPLEDYCRDNPETDECRTYDN